MIDVRRVLGVRLPDAGMVEAAAGMLESVRQPGADGPGGWAARNAISWRVTVSPGSIRVGTRAVGRPDVVDSEVEARAEAWARHDADLAMLELDGLEDADPDKRAWTIAEITEAAADAAAKTTRRGEVAEWSQKSRVRMIERLASLDYAPLYSGERSPAMVTLTLPGNWSELCPDGRTFKAAVERWKTLYARRFGAPLAGVWKLEFQRRGAPHLHILMTPPPGFRQWVGEAWRKAVWKEAPPRRHDCAGALPMCGDCYRVQAYEWHALAGTGVDYAEGSRMTDPRRIAVYFTKHAAPGGAASKEYQHRVPALWQRPGAGPGRFWGVWGLAPVVRVVEVSPEDGITAGRILRRHARANGGTRRVRLWRNRIDSETGEVTGGRWRHSTVRVERMKSGRGFVCLNDAPSVLGDLARYLDQQRQPRPAQPPPKGLESRPTTAAASHPHGPQPAP